MQGNPKEGEQPFCVVYVARIDILVITDVLNENVFQIGEKVTKHRCEWPERTVHDDTSC